MRLKNMLHFQFERSSGKKELVVKICYVVVLIAVVILIIVLNIVSDENGKIFNTFVIFSLTN